MSPQTSDGREAPPVDSSNEVFTRPEETEAEIKDKLRSLERLLDKDEIKYIEWRRNYSAKNTVWFSKKTIAVTIATFIASFLLVSLYASFSSGRVLTSDLAFPSFLRSAEISIPIALGLSLIAIIVSIAINNLHLQKENADIGASFSEVMILRSKITLLREKLASMKLGSSSSSVPSSA